MYANTLTTQALNTIMANRTRPYIIILQGDHGYRFYDKRSDEDKMFSILNAFYFSDGDYRLLYDSISSVNTFRVVLNKYFKQNYELLKDSIVHVKDEDFPFEKKE